VDTVRFLFCAESIVATAGRIEVLGCQVKQSSAYGLRLEDADAVLRGTVVDSTGTKGLVANRSTVEIDGCQFTNDPVSAIVSYDSHLHIVRTTMTATGDTALWVSGGQARLDDSYIGGPVKVVILARAGSAVEAYNTTLPPGTLMAMDDSTIDVWWQFRVRVTVQGGSPPPPPVAVLVRDLTGAEAFNGTAGADGSTPWTWGEQYHVTTDSLGARTPHAVTVVVMGSRFESSFQLKSRVDHLVVIPRTLVPRISYAGPVDEGAEVTFDGSGSAGVPFPIVSWEWDFAHSGDFVVKATGRTARWTFARDGLYEVALRVTDSRGNNNTTVVDVAARDTAPTAQILGEPPSVVDEDQAVTLEGRYVSPVDPIVLQEWDFGDGRTAQGPTATHSWTERGNYTVRYSVLDQDGSTALATVRIEVRDVTPVAVAPPGPILAQKGKGVFLDGSRSHDTPSDNGSLTYVWDLGNGGRLLGAQVDYAYEHGGNYTVTLTVTDDDGASSTATVLVRVKDEPPRVAPIGDVPLKDTDPAYTLVLGPFLRDPDDALKNLTVTVSVAGTELIRADPRLDPAMGWVIAITPRKGEQGTARVTLTVADPDGALAGRTFNVTVTREGGVLKGLEQGWATIAVVMAIVAGVAVAVVIARARRKGKDGP
jgi:PKD repeat protein